ncbi:hypothetical protein CN427_28060 [Bacillus thuringiensis]|nr:hypothetical protein CN427_28060 [Bacillus thuringiensis]
MKLFSSLSMTLLLLFSFATASFADRVLILFKTYRNKYLQRKCIYSRSYKFTRKQNCFVYIIG